VTKILSGPLPKGIDGHFAALEKAPHTPFPGISRAHRSAGDAADLSRAPPAPGRRYSTCADVPGDVMEVTLNATCKDVFYCCLLLYTARSPR
jgi:fatty-acyl-CoA synthase